MANLIVFQLTGDFTSGFQVTLEAFLKNNSFDGRKRIQLPPEPQLLQTLTSWQQEYRKWGANKRIKVKKVIRSKSTGKNLSFYGQQLVDQFQFWLSSPRFQELNSWVYARLNHQESARILISADNQKLHQLPWHQWEVIQDRPNIAIAVSKLDFKGISQQPKNISIAKSQVRILAIFGNSQNIDVKHDLKTLKTLDNTHLKPLFEPSREELFKYLWSESWDIVFFAGHSETINGQGIIHLNRREVLSIKDLKYAFKKAIDNGLKLAIFNSCDGLGLAYALGELSIPQLIVMREPIIDRVAHKFLDFFISEYSNGEPLHIATRKARERLQALESEYPYSSWLPVLYQNQATPALSWSELISSPEENVPKLTPINYLAYSMVGILAIGLSWLFSVSGLLQNQELNSYDHALSLKPIEPKDQRVLIVTIDDQDINYQDQQKMIRKGSLADQALAELLTKVKPYQPIAIASDIVHDFPYQPEFRSNILGHDNFITICRIRIDEKRDTLSPPPQINLEQIGFSNIALDQDGVIRRHILGMAPFPDNKNCQSQVSLGLTMAIRYLDYLALTNNQQQRYPRSQAKNKQIKIGEVVFPQLSANSGAYQLDKQENLGYKILLNARNTPFTTISLRKLLQENSSQQLKSLISGKIIFIGVDSINSDRYHISGSKKIANEKVQGVVIHAQAASQIISAVLDQRKLIRWSSNRTEFLWISFWSVIGLSITGLTYLKSLQKYRLVIVASLTTAIALFILYSIFIGLLIFYSYWIPIIAPSLALLLSTTGGLWLRSVEISQQNLVTKQ